MSVRVGMCIKCRKKCLTACDFSLFLVLTLDYIYCMYLPFEIPTQCVFTPFRKIKGKTPRPVLTAVNHP